MVLCGASATPFFQFRANLGCRPGAIKSNLATGPRVGGRPGAPERFNERAGVNGCALIAFFYSSHAAFLHPRGHEGLWAMIYSPREQFLDTRVNPFIEVVNYCAREVLQKCTRAPPLAFLRVQIAPRLWAEMTKWSQLSVQVFGNCF